MSNSGAVAPISQASEQNLSSPSPDVGARRLLPLRQVYNALSAWLNRPLRVLEINCGEGFFSLHLASWGATVIGIDASGDNIASAKAAAEKYQGLSVQFLPIPMKAILDTVNVDDFDLIVDFNVHKWIYSYGFGWTQQALEKMSAKAAAGLFEADLNAVYSAPRDNPENLFAGYAFLRRMEPVSNVPVYFASNRLYFDDGRCGVLEQRNNISAFQKAYEAHNGNHYRAPNDLAVTSLPLKRILLIGTCLVARWVDVISNAHDGCTCDQVLFSLSLPAQPPQPIGNYDFQVIQIPLRYILPDQKLFQLPGADAKNAQQLFDETVEALLQYLDTGLHWNKQHGILSFVANFLAPQQNPLGRLLPRKDLRNAVYFVEQLNARLEDALVQYKNAYMLDIDQIAATFGKKFIQDDNVYHWTHAGTINDFDLAYDQKRLELPVPMTLYYRSEVSDFILAAWTELVASYRTIRQVDMVKLVVIDLDDTLWRGVLGEADSDDPWVVEGWPLGFIETLHYLKARGVLLAIISKNEEERIADIWNRTVGRLISLNDFAVLKINRRTKAENLAEILQETNLLPRNTVFIDDNPVERAGIGAAYPDVRTLGAHLYYIRRVLLWSPETQVASITDEAGRRTEMIQAQVERETQRKSMTREEFLASLGLQVRLRSIDNVADDKFVRAFELLNKTNQFNTNGRRWTHAECVDLFAKGGAFYTFDAEDRFTKYGLIGVIIVNSGNIEQMVMSCRVAGLEVEIAAIAGVLGQLKTPSITGSIKETGANAMVRDLYMRCGFVAKSDGMWTRYLSQSLPVPAHIQLSN